MESQNLFSKLWERKFFQYLATFLGASWVVIQLVDWITKRYGIDDVWVERTGLFILLLTPTVISLIYNHGNDRDIKWTTGQKRFYLSNFFIALLLPFFIQNAKANTSSLKEIKVENEFGDTISRSIHDVSEIKRLGLFYNDKNKADQSENWVDEAVGLLLNYDLEQDMRISLFGTSLLHDIDNYSYTKEDELPLSVKLKIAKNNFLDFILDSHFTVDKENILSKIQIIDVKSGKAVTELEMKGKDIYELTDNLSSAIRQNLYGQDTEMSTFVDLPASNLISRNPAVIKILSEIPDAERNKIDENVEKVYQDILETTKLDPQCALCFQILSGYEIAKGLEYKKSINKAVELSQNTTERIQLDLKLTSYLVENDIPKAKKLCEMWMKLYPQDELPYKKLMNLAMLTGDMNQATSVGENAIKNGVKGKIYVDLAEIYAKIQNYSKADSLLNIFEKNYPLLAQESPVSAKVLNSLGEYKKAQDRIEEVLILNPNNAELEIVLADSQFGQGNSTEAVNTLKTALSHAKSINDSLSVQEKLVSTYIASGQINKAFETERDYKNNFLTIYPKINYIQKLYGFCQYFDFIANEKIRNDYINSSVDLAPAHAALFTDVNEFLITTLDKNGESFHKNLDHFIDLQTKTQGEIGRGIVLGYDYYLSGNYEESLKYFEQYVDKSGIPLYGLGSIASILMQNINDREKQKEYFELIEKYVPYNLNHNLFYAQYLIQNNENSKAKEVLKRSIELGKNADENASFITEIRELYEKL
ncbi:MAG TPA: tetratricopeptide repeat protein [Saprospiraceae bacterium]|nr:tetratricopeptide repeat protein [Saprospiraceae bacterium]MCB9329049.1 tetratricopeptide repeat protein [Lewinellaceae bacterium]HRX28700.1 tetratricopeptide repeat protein [Saprospiraceae bacterium]